MMVGCTFRVLLGMGDQIRGSKEPRSGSRWVVGTHERFRGGLRSGDAEGTKPKRLIAPF